MSVDASEVASEISEELASSESFFEGSNRSLRSDGRNKSISNQYPPAHAPSQPVEIPEDEYSFSFDDNDESNGYNYSQDFEAPESSHLPSSSVKKTTVASTVQSFPPASQHLPSMELQTLQAELSLQKLSEEVIQLRNKQRSLLKERWNQVKEKKARAEERRAQHQKELNELRQRVSQVERQNEDLTVLNNNLTANIKSSENSIELLKSANDRSIRAIELKEEELTGANKKIDELLNKISELEVNAAGQTALMNRMKEEMGAEILRRDLQIEVLQKSMVASETR